MPDLLGIQRLTLTDSLGNKLGEVIAVVGKSSSADAGPDSLEIKSLLPNHGTIVWLMPNGLPAVDTDTGLIVYGSGDGPFTGLNHEYLEVGINYGADGKPQYYFMGQKLEGNGAAGPKDVHLMAGGGTVIKLSKEGNAEIYRALRLMSDTPRPAASSELRGAVWYSRNPFGQDDSVDVCIRLADGTYSWRRLW